jgi:hypothetical protein
VKEIGFAKVKHVDGGGAERPGRIPGEDGPRKRESSVLRMALCHAAHLVRAGTHLGVGHGEWADDLAIDLCLPGSVSGFGDKIAEQTVT